MKRILVVDDEHGMRLTLGEFLRNEKYDVHTAEDSEEAMQFLKNYQFDVVISDILLPKASGVDLLRKIQEITPEVKVILMTGQPTVETAVQAVRKGAFDYLSKPISREMLLRVVSNAIRMKILEEEQIRLKKENSSYRKELERMVNDRTQALLQSEENYISLSREMPLGFAYHKIIADKKGYPVDCKFVEVNPAFERMFNKNRNELLNQSARETYPDYFALNGEWLEKFHLLSEKGGSLIENSYIKSVERELRITLYRTRSLHLVAIFDDINL